MTERGNEWVWTAALLLLAACGGATGGADAAATSARSATPGATDPSSASGSNGLQIGANAGPGGALFYNEHPFAGEPSVSGLVVVLDGRTAPPRNDPPADTVVTLNGVPLVHAVLGGAPSPRYFTVDPSGPQPTLGADGFLHLVASSASAGASRQLNLACPPAVGLTSTPAAGTSLAGAASVTLRWPDALPASTVPASFGLADAAATLMGFDAATNAPAALVSNVSVATGAREAVLAAGAPTSTGWLAELRYPGVFFVDHETGGACGRTLRLVFPR